MIRINRHLIGSILLVVAIVLNLLNVQVALADDNTPPPPPTAEPTQPPAEPPATEPPVSADPGALPTDPPPAEGEAPVSDMLADLPENTEVIVVDENGVLVPLASLAAVQIIEAEDPMWCPIGVPLDSPLCHNFTGDGSVQALIDSMRDNPGLYSSDGIIYFTSNVNGSFELNDAPTSLGESFTTLSLFNLTLQGGWDGSLAGPINLGGQSLFGANTISIGTSSNPWTGALTINNISTLNTTSTSDASLTINSNGIVELNNVIAAGSGTGQDGISISAPAVNLNNVSSSYHEGNGISINAASSGGVVTLNNVIASNNGHMDGLNPVGSGVLINGSETMVDVIGGSYTNNARYGIEALNSISTTLPAANIWTDTQDYTPGSVVTISGGDNNLNGNNVGFLAGETIHVDVQGPNGYIAACEAIANEFGKWSCQITLWTGELAVGEYSYSAAGLTSGVLVSGAFTDARNIQNGTLLNGITTQITVAPGGTITVVINVITTGNGVDNDWLSTGYRIATTTGAMTCINHADHTTAGNYTETFTIPAPAIPGTYNVYFYAYNDDACSSGQSTLQTLTNRVIVSKITPTLSVTNTPVTYNGSPHTATVAGSVPGTVSNIRYNGSATAPTNAATYAVTADFTPTDSITYNSLTGASAGNFVINKATPTLIVTNSPVTYNGSPQAASVSGSVTGTIGNVRYNGSLTVPTNAATYAITANFVPSDSTNYNSLTSAAAGNFLINRATPTIAFSAAPTPIFPGPNFTVSATTTNTQSSVLTYSRVSGPCAFVSGSTFSSAGVGTCVVQASGAATSNFNAATQTQNVTISSANTPPIVSVTGVTNGASYQIGSVPAAGCSVVDTQDGNSTFAATLGAITGPLSAFGLGSQTASCAYTDGGGLSGSASATYSIIDTVAPSATAGASPAANGNGWNSTNVTVSFTGSDAGSGIAFCSAPVLLSAEGAGQSVSGTCTDHAGNVSATATASGINIDKTAPTASANRSPAANGNGWNNTPVTVSFTGSDALSGLDFCTSNILLSAEGAGQSASGTCTDKAGNVSGSATASGINIDLTKPVLSLPATITVQATSSAGALVNFTASASDILDPSPSFSCSSASGGTFPIGTTIVACSSTDRAGNTQSGSFNIIVQDTSGPTLSLPANITAEATSAAGAAVTFSATASDVVDGPVATNCVPPSGSTFVLGTTAVNCSATDSNLNTSTGSFNVTVKDTTPPAISPMASISTTTGNNAGAVVNFVPPTTTDAVDGAGTATCAPVSGSIFPVGTTSVTCSASDAAGNSSSLTFNVHVNLTTRSTPPQNSLFGGSIIVVTGGEQINLGCFTELYAFGIKVTFINLCGHQTIINGMEPDRLPASLPSGYTFVKGLDVQVLKQGKALELLPDNTGVKFDFPSPGAAKYALLFWDGSKWIEISDSISETELNKLLDDAQGDELFRIGTTSNGHSKALTTGPTGTFVLVTK